MARNKVKLAWIANDSARKATFKRRKKGLFKKVSELSTLCGVQACAIVYGPYGPNPEVWPSLPEAHDVMSNFKSMSEMEKSKKMVNQEGFLTKSIAKAKEQCLKLQKVNHMNQMKLLINQSIRGKGFQDMAFDDLNDFSHAVEENMMNVHDRMEYLRKSMVVAPQMMPTSDVWIPVAPVQMSMPQMQMLPIQLKRPIPRQIPMQTQMQLGIGSGDNREVEKIFGHQDMLEDMLRYP